MLKFPPEIAASALVLIPRPAGETAPCHGFFRAAGVATSSSTDTYASGTYAIGVYARAVPDLNRRGSVFEPARACELPLFLGAGKSSNGVN